MSGKAFFTSEDDQTIALPRHTYDRSIPSLLSPSTPLSTVGPYEDRRLRALVANARGDLVYALLLKGGAPFHRHVDVGDCQSCVLHHGERWHDLSSKCAAYLPTQDE
jgi:hypothetical protein